MKNIENDLTMRKKKHWILHFLKLNSIAHVFIWLAIPKIVFAEPQILNKPFKVSSLEISSERFNASTGRKVLFLAGSGKELHLITLIRGKEESVYLNLPSPVDCDRIGYRLKSLGSKSKVFIAHLDDSEDGLRAPYTIEEFNLKINYDEEPGVQLFSFIKEREVRTKKAYCSSKDAIDELEEN